MEAAVGNREVVLRKYPLSGSPQNSRGITGSPCFSLVPAKHGNKCLGKYTNIRFSTIAKLNYMRMMQKNII
jgi:hypothetical protein